MSLPNASGKEAEGSANERDGNPGENGEIPIKGLGKSRKAVGRDRRAHVGAGIENARIGRDLPERHKSARNDGNEHQVDTVHSGNGERHQNKRGDKRRLGQESIHKEQGSADQCRAAKNRGGTGDLVLEESLLQNAECRIADHGKDGENNGGNDRVFLAESKGLKQKRGHPVGHTVAQHSLHHNAGHDHGERAEYVERNGQSLLHGFGGRSLCFFFSDVCLFEHTRIEKEPEQNHYSPPCGAKQHNGAPLHHAKQKRTEQIQGDGGNR